MNARACCVLGAVLIATAQWQEFHADTLGIAFRHPGTVGLRFETRAATCSAADRSWQGGVIDSVVVVTRTVARIEQIAAFLGIVRDGAQWVAEGYQGSRTHVARVQVGRWDALLAEQAVTVVYDMALRAPAPAKQWRFVALGPANDGCHPMLVALATGMPAVWDSSAVDRVLKSARTF